MTTPDYDSMPAGLEMDALVHQKVFGRRVEFRKGREIGRIGDAILYAKDFYYDPDDTTKYLHMTDGFTGMIPSYSTSISDAWRVVEYLRTTDENGSYQRVWVRFCNGLPGGSHAMHLMYHLSPLVICRAALKAMSQEV